MRSGVCLKFMATTDSNLASSRVYLAFIAISSTQNMALSGIVFMPSFIIIGQGWILPEGPLPWCVNEFNCEV
jgi:hypothetical protein